MPASVVGRPPVALRGLLNLAALIVPADDRATWRARRHSLLQSLLTLALRGELAGKEAACIAWWCRRTFADALATRWGKCDLRSWARGPAFLVGAACGLVLFLAACTHGLAVTRSLLTLLGRVPQSGFSDRLVGNLLPILFALATAVMASAGQISLRGRSFRYIGFLLLKMALLTTIMVLLWVEGGAALRASLPNAPLRVLIGGVLLTVTFVVSFDWVILWGLADQHHRCPVCLRRLVMPVRIGSWASVFEPVTTEWLCDTGHGLLSMSETETGRPDCWTALQPHPAAFAEMHLR
jgi:hypothetical protein